MRAESAALRLTVPGWQSNSGHSSEAISRLLLTETIASMMMGCCCCWWSPGQRTWPQSKIDGSGRGEGSYALRLHYDLKIYSVQFLFFIKFSLQAPNGSWGGQWWHMSLFESIVWFGMKQGKSGSQGHFPPSRCMFRGEWKGWFRRHRKIRIVFFVLLP